MSGVSVGDMALCIDGEFSGWHCTVIGDCPHALQHNDLSRMPMRGWIVQFPQPMDWGHVGSKTGSCVGWYPDAWLMRIGQEQRSVQPITSEVGNHGA